MRPRYDAIVVGSGPNGLAAALTLAKRGKQVLVVEAGQTLGGGLRSQELTLPGFIHDHCATVHALAPGSRFFRENRLEDEGLNWVCPDAPLAHLLDDGRVVMLYRSVEQTARELGPDAAAYARLVEPLLQSTPELLQAVMEPLTVPRHPLRIARFGWQALRSADSFIQATFRSSPARTLMAGLAAHTGVPLEMRCTAAASILLALVAHAHGWPLAQGGSRQVVTAIERQLRARGVEFVTDWRVRDVDELHEAGAVLLDLTARNAAHVGRSWLSRGYRRRLVRMRPGSAVAKVDWALSSPAPWRNEACLRAGTLHMGGDADAIAKSLRDTARGVVPERPFVIAVQASLFDATRAPAGAHTLWAYCQTPLGCRADMLDAIEREIERHAPGFRQCVMGRRVTSPAALEQYNANYRGGDISGGAMSGLQAIARPFPSLVPYATNHPKLFLCSSSTPPGGGIHGMCGYNAARVVLRRGL